MDNEIQEKKFKEKLLNKKILKVMGILFLVILNVGIGLEMFRTESGGNIIPYPTGYTPPSLQDVELKNMLYSIIKAVVSVMYMIYIVVCFIYFKVSKKTSCEKKRKILLWLSNCLVTSLMLFCGLKYFSYCIINEFQTFF